MVNEIAGWLPVSRWKLQRAHGVFATTMRDRDGPSPARTKIVTNYNQQHRYYTAVDRHARNQLLSRDDLKEHLPVEGV